MSESHIPTFQEYFLKPGYIYVPRMPTLVSTVLGSCVAVVLWDQTREYGGMSHYLYPLTRDPKQATAQYGNVALRVLIGFFLEDGSRKRDLQAQIFGGAHPDEAGPVAQVSRQNVDVGRKLLSRSGIRIVSEDVGGTRGRKVVYNTSTNEVAVLRVDRLREGDWYPYEEHR